MIAAFRGRDDMNEICIVNPDINMKPYEIEDGIWMIPCKCNREKTKVCRECGYR